MYENVTANPLPVGPTMAVMRVRGRAARGPRGELGPLPVAARTG